MSRIAHGVFGPGVILEEFISTGGGQKVARCVFDDSPESERILLISCLKPSDAPVPAQARKPVKKSRAMKGKPVSEPVTDELLVERIAAPVLPNLDPLPDDSSDYDDPGGDSPEESEEVA